MTRIATLLAAALAALTLAACGDEGEPIPTGQAEALIRGLETAQRQAAQGSCGTLRNTTIPALEQRADRLRSTVSADTRETIQDGVAHLRDLAEDDCTARQEEELPTTSDTTTSETTTPETTTPETTTPEETTPEETTPPETTPPETTPPETTPPEPGNPGSGNGGTPPGQEKKGSE